MPINAHPDYLAAEKEYLKAETLEDKIEKLKKMISVAPSHKGAENLRAQLKTRLKKFQEQLAKSKKSGKSKQKGIKKQDLQAVIVSLTNTGKSSLLKLLTNSEPKIAEYKFTTKKPVLGTMHYAGTNIQLIEIPAIESEYYDRGLANAADTILILITNLEQIKEIEKQLDNAHGKRIIIFNNKDNLDERKVKATLQSRKYNFVLLPSLSKRVGGKPDNENALEELKNKIFQSFDKIRIYTKEPGKEKSPKPIIMKPNPTVKDVAEKILKGFSNNVRETKIWGPSSKFAGQKVGLKHKLKNLDVVEFKTK